jgi:FlaA1/EpsC-like NDP-sugar epimerase
VQQKINELADAARPLAVWGVGTHTLRLLETSRLPEARIVAYLDSNANYQGKQLAGVPVLAPADFSDPSVEILISTQTAEDEIARTITHTLRWPNVVHRLYGS